jgi:hypothetical protein
VVGKILPSTRVVVMKSVPTCSESKANGVESNSNNRYIICTHQIIIVH